MKSFTKVLQPTLHETCLPALIELYSELRCIHGRPPPVVLSEDLVENPEGTLRALCMELNIPFDPAMLEWSRGPKPEIDGVWAPWWYKNTWKSTGFHKPGGSDGSKDEDEEEVDEENTENAKSNKVSMIELDPLLGPLLEECRPLYEFLRRQAIKPLPKAAPTPTKTSKTHAYTPDARNANIYIGIRDGSTMTMKTTAVQEENKIRKRNSSAARDSFALLRRTEAKVSVLDSGFMLGDGVWEGIRADQGVLLFMDEHLDRLWEGMKALDMRIGMSRDDLVAAMAMTLHANEMDKEDSWGVHIRLMVTRGLKATPYQHPSVTIGAPTIVILPEWKRVVDVDNDSRGGGGGVRLFTVHVRRGQPDVQDPGWNSHSKLNCIAACIQADKAGADEALMLDPRGFVSTCNSTNFFIVRKGEVWTAGPGYQMAGITRGKVISLCRQHNIPVRECDFSLTQVYGADEAFVTGTFAGLVPVCEVDGRRIGDRGGGRGAGGGPVTRRLQELYKELCRKEVARKRKGSGCV